MISYWILFIIPAFLALIGRVEFYPSKYSYKSRNFGFLWWSIIITLTLMIGFRFQVGGDWGNYLNTYINIQNLSLKDAFNNATFMADPAFLILNWLSAQVNFGVYGVNLVLGAIFAYGLARFCKQLPRPLLGLVSAIPYLVIVVGMGYSRQAGALGFGLLALVALQENKKLKFFLWILLAATIHKTALLLLPLAGLAASTNRIYIIFWLVMIFTLSYIFLLAQAVSFLYEHYIQDSYQSSGAFIRIAMTFVPSIIFLLYKKRFKFSQEKEDLWKWIAYFTILCMAVLMLTSISAALDRMALYFLPMQIMVFSYLPDLFGNRGRVNQVIKILIISYYGLVLFVWLNFAYHAGNWLPYRNLLFEW